MKTLFILILLSFQIKSFGCICDLISIDSAAKLSNFIAHVKVIEKTRLSSRDSLAFGEGNFWVTRQLHFEIIELFKGDTSKLKIIDGVQWTCNIGIGTGEEYILFAYPFKEKYSIVDYCFKWFILRDKYGQRSWDYKSGLYGLKDLRKLFNHEDPAEPDGIKTSFYPDGKIEAKEEYLNGKLHSNQSIYYANGQIRYDENYKLGRYEGIQREYSESGQLLEETIYLNGKEIRSISWYDTTEMIYEKGRSGRHMHDITIKQERFYLNVKDSIFCMKEYSPEKKLIEETFIFDRDVDDCYVKYHYYDNGSLYYYSEYYRKNKKEICKEWDKKGKLKFDRIYIAGKVVENRIKKK